MTSATIESISIEHVTGEMIYVRLGDLVHSPFNVRQDDTSDVCELAALIDAQTLLQNLVVVPHHSRRSKASSGPKYGVVAGGRRRRAMLLLVEQGKMTLDEEVLCKLTTVELAIRASAAENSGREPLSAADTVMAFRAMVDAGATAAEVAICFGVSELTVERRLKLANVSPTLFELFRAGEITVDQLAALAVSDDHEAQERVWTSMPQYNRSASNLRRMLIGEDIDAARDPIAQFVGLAAYEAAGGLVKRDLFSADGCGAIMNAELLHSLAMTQLEEQAARVKKEGWGWVEARPSLGYSELHQFDRAPKSERPATPKEQARITALEAERDVADEQLENEDEPDVAKLAELEKVFEKASSELAKIAAKRSVWTADVMALAGAIVTVDHQGKQVTHRGLVKPEDRKQVAKTATREAVKDAGDDEADGSDHGGAEQLSAHSEALVRKLTAHRTKALQLALSQNTHVALAALAHALLQQTVVEGIYRPDSALKVRAELCDGDMSRVADDIATSPAWIELASHVDNLRERVPGDSDKLLPWLIGQPLPALLDILAMCAALTVNTMTSTEVPHAGDELSDAVGLDMADWWTPTAGSYLNQVPKARIVAAVSEAAGVEVGAPLAKAKKGEAVAKAEATLAGKRWLPTVLRQREVR